MYISNNIKYLNKNKKTIIECLDKTIESFTVENSVEIISENAFKDCYLLKKINLDTNNKNGLLLENNAFPEPSVKELIIGNASGKIGCMNIDNLKSLTFTKNALDVDGKFFYGTNNTFAPLEKITLEKEILSNDNYEYFTKDNVLYAEDKSKDIYLIYYPPTKNDKIYKVENFVTYISQYAFSHTQNLETIVFSKNLNNKEECSFFNDCKNLKNMVFLGKYFPVPKPFKCPNFKNIYASFFYASSKSGDISVKPLEDFYAENFMSFKDINNFCKDIER